MISRVAWFKTMLWLMALPVLFASAAGGYWFADEVVSYNPGPGYWVTLPQFNDPTRCLGAPKGLYVDEPDNTSLASLGDGGSITLAFGEDILDDPRNPYGLDFVVFSNALFVGGNPFFRWQELAFVEISPNSSDWFLILPSILPSDLVGGVDTGQSSTVVSGYAEYTPTVGLPQDLVLPSFPVSRTAEELYTIPERPSVPGDPSSIAFDYVSGGGDAFDIADAVVQIAPGVAAVDDHGEFIPAHIDRFRYIRITDALTGDSIPGLYEISAEISGVARVRPQTTIGAAKRGQPNEYMVTTSAVVSAVFDDEFYVQSPDRSAGMRVVSDQSVEPGDVLTISGHVSHTDSGRAIADPMFTVTSHGPAPAPLGMPIRSAASDLACGLLVTTWGRVIDSGDGFYCIIADGEHSARIVSDHGVFAATGSYVTITGICEKGMDGQPIVKLTDLVHIQ